MYGALVLFQLGANALLFLSVNMYGVFVRVLAERSQRKAFLQARNCIEDRLRLEDENEKQVSAAGLRAAGMLGVGSVGRGEGMGEGTRGGAWDGGRCMGGKQGVGSTGQGGGEWGARGGKHRVGRGARAGA